MNWRRQPFGMQHKSSDHLTMSWEGRSEHEHEREREREQGARAGVEEKGADVSNHFISDTQQGSPSGRNPGQEEQPSSGMRSRDCILTKGGEHLC